MKDFWKAIRTVLVNQFIIGIPAQFINYLTMQQRGCTYLPEDLPTFKQIMFELAIFGVVEEIGFYYSHRMVHLPFFYKHIHKKHHEWTAPIGIVSIYAHPFEHFFSNLTPVALGMLLMRSHLATFFIWIALALGVTIVHHSGYHLPFLTSPEFHDYHHLK